MFRQIILGLAAAFAFSVPARAQVADSLASTSFEYYPSAGDDSRPGESVSLEVFRVRAGVPIPVGESTMLIAGASYEMLNVHASGESSFQLHAPALTFGAIQKLGERWAVWGLSDVGFASDFSDSMSSDDVLASATGLVSYRFGDALTLGAGATYDRRSGQLTPLPAVLVNWRIAQRARVRGFVPAHLTAEYRVTQWFDAGVRGTFEGNRFHVGKSRFGEENLELAYSIVTVGPKITLSPSDWLHFDLYAAAAVHRRYEFFRNDDSIADHGLDNVVGYGIKFRIGPSEWDGPAKLDGATSTNDK